MRIFKGADFNQWARKYKIRDEALLGAVDEISRGLVDANLGGGIIKKRVAVEGRGKRGGARTILAFKVSRIAFFIYGYAKNEKSDLTPTEEKALKMLAKSYFSLSETDLAKAVTKGQLIEIETNGE